MQPEALIVLRPDGRIEHVDGAPVEWLHHLPDEIPSMPAVLRVTVQRLLAARPASSERILRRARVECEDGGAPRLFEVLVIEAVPLRRSLVSLVELVMRALDPLVVQATASEVELRFERGERVPATLLVDGEKLTWGVTMLVGNALRHLAVAPRPKHPRIDVGIRFDARGDAVEIRVTDNGPGIPPETLRHLFDTNPATGKSAGLALVLLQDVLAAHRGSVTASSVCDGEAHGTTFVLRVPRY